MRRLLSVYVFLRYLSMAMNKWFVEFTVDMQSSLDSFNVLFSVAFRDLEIKRYMFQLTIQSTEDEMEWLSS